jgi:hypothetical protein
MQVDQLTNEKWWELEDEWYEGGEEKLAYAVMMTSDERWLPECVHEGDCINFCEVMDPQPFDMFVEKRLSKGEPLNMYDFYKLAKELRHWWEKELSRECIKCGGPMVGNPYDECLLCRDPAAKERMKKK